MNVDLRRSELRLAALRRLDLPRDYNDSQFTELDAHNFQVASARGSGMVTGQKLREAFDWMTKPKPLR